MESMSEQPLVELIARPEEQYILLSPQHLPPRSGDTFNLINPSTAFEAILNSIQNSRVVAIDFETKGGDYSDDLEVQGVGLAWDEGSCYFDRDSLTEEQGHLLLETVGKHRGLIAHNVYFDGGVFKKVMGYHARWHVCTYSTYAMLSNEGYAGRTWGLKTAQTELLLWETSNEGELDEWLVVNGFYIGNRRVDSSPEYLRNEYQSGGLRPDKAEMWRAPSSVLGKYCILDAESTYLFYTRILAPKLLSFPDLMSYMTTEWMNLIRILIDQKLAGIQVDRPGLLARRDTLLREISELEIRFINHEQCRDHIRSIEDVWIGELRATEPPRLKKDGDVSKNWLKWEKRVAAAEARENPEYRFNIGSAHQLRELLYTRLKYPVKIRTEKGEPSTSIKALRSLGGLGSILTERMWLVKELSFIDKYLELTEHRPTIHPSFRTPGTVSGRLSSKEPNMQQIPKSKAMMSLFVARPGHVWVDLDFSALEPVVATEYSQDPNMLRIYGDNMPENDIYIFVMAHISGMGDRARALGYDPYNPTKAALSRVKKDMKRERGICKTVVLACQYGAGINKVHQTLEEDEIFLDISEVANIHKGYWDLFSGVKDFSRSLYFEWKRNKGYIFNAINRPMAIPNEFDKDILNRFIQSTGHDILVKYIHILSRNLTRAGIPWTPIIIDFHDATTVEVPEGCADRTVDIFNRSMLELNELLNGTIKLRGTPVVGTTLADCKEPES